MTAREPARDQSWRWSTCGSGGLTATQAEDARLSFRAWLDRFGLGSLAGYPVDSLEEFVVAVQSMPRRPCGLEGVTFASAWPGDVIPATGDRLRQCDARLGAASAAALDAYRSFDAAFEAWKSDPVLHVPADLSDQATVADRAAWLLVSAWLDEAGRVRAAGGRPSQSPAQVAWVRDRASRWCATVLSPDLEVPPSAVPVNPFGGRPRGTLDAADREILGDWVARYGEASAEERRLRLASGETVAERAAMIRWLEATGMLDDMADAAGGSLAAGSTGLDGSQRADLRALRDELSGLHAARKACREHGASEGATAEADVVARRLDDMAKCHRARGKHAWVRSFHFDPDARAEAFHLAPQLMSAAQAEFMGEIDGQEEAVFGIVSSMPPAERDALVQVAASGLAGGSGKPRAAARAVRPGILLQLAGILPALASRIAALASSRQAVNFDAAARKVPDWRVEGMAASDGELRASASGPARDAAREKRDGYARAAASDPALMAKLRLAARNVAEWVDTVSGNPGPLHGPGPGHSRRGTDKVSPGAARLSG